jgi:serine/threonine protein kinase
MEDLQIHIDRLIMTRTCHECGPFLKKSVEFIMYGVAKEMDWLHNLNIIHEDLKASNVLFKGVVPQYLAVLHTKFDHIGFP